MAKTVKTPDLKVPELPAWVKSLGGKLKLPKLSKLRTLLKWLFIVTIPVALGTVVSALNGLADQYNYNAANPVEPGNPALTVKADFNPLHGVGELLSWVGDLLSGLKSVLSGLGLLGVLVIIMGIVILWLVNRQRKVVVVTKPAESTPPDTTTPPATS